MTLVSSIIRGAMRETNIISRNQPVPDDETDEWLGRLQAVINSAYGFDVGEELTDWPIGDVGVNQNEEFVDWTAQFWQYPVTNSRLVYINSAASTVYLAPEPMDGARMMLIDPASKLTAAPLTIDANGRTIEGSATFVANTNGLARTWMYRADLGGWTLVSALASTDQMPFPPEFDDYFIIKLAARMNPRYGRTLSDLSLAELQRTLTQLNARYRQKRDMPISPALMALQPQFNGNNPRYWAQRGDTGQYGYRWGWMS